MERTLSTLLIPLPFMPGARRATHRTGQWLLIIEKPTLESLLHSSTAPLHNTLNPTDVLVS